MIYTYDENTYGIMYKETWGYSPYSDHLFYESGTGRDQKQILWDALEDAHDAASEHLRRSEFEAIEGYEQEIASCLAAGATRSIAIQRIAQGHDIEDPDELVWMLGLPWDFRKEVIRAMEKAQ